jgi:hypothetical protein
MHEEGCEVCYMLQYSGSGRAVTSFFTKSSVSPSAMQPTFYDHPNKFQLGILT